MRKLWMIVVLLLIALVGGASVSASASPAKQVSTFTCVDFNSYPDDTPFPASFVLGGMDFNSLSGNDMFANETGGSIGLQFQDAGLDVAFPQPVNHVLMFVGAWARPLDITAIDSAGSVVDSVSLTRINMYHVIRLNGADITHVEFIGGGHEGILVFICADFKGEPGECFNFDDLALETEYKVGDVITGLSVMVIADPFVWLDGTSTSDGFASVTNAGMAGGSGYELNVNNISIRFSLNVPASRVTLKFGEYGGNVNLTVNGDFQNTDNFADLSGMQLGGAQVSVVNGLGNDMGELAIDGGPIHEFSIGGQELAIDDVCLEIQE